MNQLRIAVVGAGIAGLTAAIAFARQGAEVVILEQAGTLSAVGAGLQLSPNATTILGELGLLPSIEARWCEIEAVSLRSGRTLAQLSEVPTGHFARARWGSPYGVIHRAELQAVLADTVHDLPRCRLMLGERLEVTSPADIKAAVALRVGFTPDLVVGADGVWSALRKRLPGAAEARFSGYAAWRTMVPAEPVRALRIGSERTAAFLGRKSHLVIYPMAGTETYNIVAVARAPESPARIFHLSAGESSRRLTEAFAGWHPAIRSMIAASGDALLWPLFEVPDGPWRAENEMVLIGDAAHAMMPFAAQGAAMAIEDADDLANTFVTSGAAGLAGFEARRKLRVDKVRKRTDFNRFAYHARGPFRLGRDLVLAMRSPESLAADFDWLYGYRAPGIAR